MNIKKTYLEENEIRKFGTYYLLLKHGSYGVYTMTPKMI